MLCFFKGYITAETIPHNRPDYSLENDSAFTSNVLLKKLSHFSDAKTRVRSGSTQTVVIGIP
jgi:hypothetical protein